MTRVIHRSAAGTVRVPAEGQVLIDRVDGGHLIVDPPEPVWDRTALDPQAAALWHQLVSDTAKAMLSVLPQLSGGCINYWDAGNWSLHFDAPPAGEKRGPTDRSLHLHLFGRSPRAVDPDWAWGEAPRFPRFREREAWSRGKQPLNEAECAAIAAALSPAARADGSPSLVVFDVIGTVVMADDVVPRAFVETLTSCGISVTDEHIRQVRGASKREAFRRLVPSSVADADRAFERFRLRLLADYTPTTVAPIPGAAWAVRQCQMAGIPVAFNTGFDRQLAVHLLRLLGWERLPDLLVVDDDVERGRPAPDMIHVAMARAGVSDPGRVAVVGDTLADLHAGEAAGARWNIGVWSGAHSRDALAAAPHTHLLASVQGLPALLGLGLEK